MAQFCAAATGPPGRLAWCIIPPPLTLWGNGDVQLEVDNARQIAYAMGLVRQAFAAKQSDGAKGSEG